MITAITFDFWNTLYNFPPDIDISQHRRQCFAHILNAAGLKVKNSDLQAAFENCWDYANYCQKVKGCEIGPDGHVNYILKCLHLTLSPEVWQKAYNAYTRELEDNPPLVREGVKESLPVLAQKYTLAVICNTGATPGVMLREFMRRDEIIDYFHTLVFSDEVGWAKPNTRIFAHTLAGIKVQPGQAAHIGDDPLTDVIGAKKSGMQAIWLAPHSTWPVPECDYHVGRVSELLTLF